MLTLNLTRLIDDAKCYETVRQLRWQAGVCCPKCRSAEVMKRGKDDTQRQRQRYQCKNCGAHFDDLTDTIFALTSSTVAGLDSLPVLDGIEPVEPPDCSRTRTRRR